MKNISKYSGTFFSFGTAYKFYEFGASTEAFNNGGNLDQEFTAVGTPSIPEPASILLVGTVLLLLCGALRLRRA